MVDQGSSSNDKKMGRKHSNIFSRQVATTALGTDEERGGIPTTLPFPPSSGRPKQRHEPARTTKTSQKLVMFPEADIPSNAIGLPEPELLPMAETDDSLRRVTAYLTAESYNLKGLLQAYKKLPGGERVRRFDEVLYCPVTISQASEPPEVIPEGEEELATLVASERSVGQVFYFDYGVTVIWGLSEEQEKQVLVQLKPYEKTPLDEEDVEVEAFHFSHSAPEDAAPCLFNDIILLRKSGSSKMLKLSISHALAQSAKLTFFEEVVETTILKTKDIPYTLAATGRINLPRLAITRQIGELLITRINVNLVSNVLDTPEIFWSQQAWAPLYRTVRGYLEISQRVEVLNQRCMVISDMLDLLRDHTNSVHGESLEWIIIVLITIEIVLGLLELFISFKRGSH